MDSFALNLILWKIVLRRLIMVENLLRVCARLVRVEGGKSSIFMPAAVMIAQTEFGVQNGIYT